MMMTVDAELKRQMGLVPKDVIAFRVFDWQGKRVMVGEKVPLAALANLKSMTAEMMDANR